ncbi:hypothetical protein O3P69_018126 [Scylla paramamosain]|uniref:Uncharacterized protein n=1 Tax=Scylla paramamosain TaxID=85552 RepID=A0AAW0TKW7_SCYPA
MRLAALLYRDVASSVTTDVFTRNEVSRAPPRSACWQTRLRDPACPGTWSLKRSRDSAYQSKKCALYEADYLKFHLTGLQCQNKLQATY